MPRSRRGRGALLLAFAAFMTVRLGEAAGAPPGWWTWWLDDLVCLPLVLTVILAVHRLAGRPATWVLPVSHGLAVLVLYILLFEIVMPRLDPLATADVLDTVAYAAGWVAFHLLINVPGGVHRGSAMVGTCGPAQTIRS